MIHKIEARLESWLRERRYRRSEIKGQEPVEWLTMGLPVPRAALDSQDATVLERTIDDAGQIVQICFRDWSPPS